MFESVMWTYMNEEKCCLQNLLDHKETIRAAAERCADLKALYITAHGSSYNAASAAASFISRIAKVRVYAYTPSSFRYNASSIHAEDKEHTVVLGISQTGTSRGVLEALESAAGFKRIAVTNEKDSPIDAMCDQTLYLGCGEENSNAKTKGYSATLLTLMIFGIELAAVKGVMDAEEIAAYYEELETCVNAIPEVIHNTVKWCETTGYGTGMEEYMAHLAERADYNNSIWNRIKEVFGRIVDKIFGTENFTFTNRELNYILRASYEHLKNPQWLNTFEGKAKDALMKRQLGINETDPNRPTDPDGPGTGRLFRDEDTGVANIDYASDMTRKSTAIITENQDADMPVRLGMNRVMKEVGKKSIAEDEDYL